MRSGILCALLAGMFTSGAQAATHVEVWHTFQGASAEVFDELAARFNRQQTDVQVNLSIQGNDEQTVEAAIKAGAAGPHLVQVRDDLNETMQQAGITRPLRAVFGLAQGDAGWLVPNTPGFPRDAQGSPYAYPIAAQVPVLLYNKMALTGAGVDAEAPPPRTWLELQAIALKLTNAGFRCPYTTSHQSWIFLENLSARHNEPFSIFNGGYRKGSTRLSFNTLIQVRHIALMNSWVVSELLNISGDNAEGDARFASGECALLTSGSGALGTVLAQKNFPLGIAGLPAYDEAAAPQWSTITGGAAFWVIDGKTKGDYKAVAQFLAFLATPEIAAEWHQRTGYLPLTQAAFKLTQQTGYYRQWPRLETQIQHAVMHSRPALKALRPPQFARLRSVINQHLNLTWAQRKPPKQALDDAVKEGNRIIGNPAPHTMPNSKNKQ